MAWLIPVERETQLIRSVTDDDITGLVVEGIVYAVLAKDYHVYLQCAVREEPPYGYLLAYCDGAEGVPLQAQDPGIGLERIVAAFLKYSRGDASWKSGFTWSIIDEYTD